MSAPRAWGRTPLAVRGSGGSDWPLRNFSIGGQLHRSPCKDARELLHENWSKYNAL